MAARQLSLLSCILLDSLFIIQLFCYSLQSTDKQVYIVYMGNLPKADASAESIHLQMLEKAVGSDAASNSLVYSYKKSFHGFAAKLSEEEMKKIARMEGIVSIFPSQKKVLHTTRSWDFMGFPQNVSRQTFENDVVVGLLDTGVWPESDSFNDEGMGPPPAKWKGSCQSSNFTCNNKIIGARFYHIGDNSSGDSPRDTEGHGTHTASTAAGRQVSGANFFGLREGTARGGVPSARIAVYKVCWFDDCHDVDILAAFDDAIGDGVDVISVSLGSPFPLEYFEDSIAIGAFHAMKNGILTSNSAGNSGPQPSLVSNYSPWSLSVAAGTIDPKIGTKLELGNGVVLVGSSMHISDSNDTLYPLVYGGDAPNKGGGYSSEQSRFCYLNSLDEDMVKGKIVLCDSTNVEGPQQANAQGAILTSLDEGDYPLSFLSFPVAVLSKQDAAKVSYYKNSTTNPVASIPKSEDVEDPTAPFVIFFSSRGPSEFAKNIIKPDITAPGVNILAAWPPEVSGSRKLKYNIISGTSMSCPHTSGAAAYVKSFHPTWSPAAIKSALMTTAYPMSSLLNKDGEFAYGSGHINPTKATDPGLIYDASEADYIRMLCVQGYNTTKLRLITGDNSTCSNTTQGTEWDLNYPSIAVSNNPGLSFTAQIPRTVTNVGSANSTYSAAIVLPDELSISVAPSTLSFTSIGQTQSFVVTVNGTTTKSMLSASLAWTDGSHHVRSPIVVYAL